MIITNKFITYTVLVLILLIPFFAFAAFNQDLYFGLKNSQDVTNLQQFLTDEKVYSGPITGNFYSLTQKAVKDFQLREKISPIAGYFGPKTRAKANEILSSKTPALVNRVSPPSGSFGTTILITPRDINLQSIVGIYCSFKDKDGNIENVRGSGIIVHPEGYVLTSRHLIDKNYSVWIETGIATTTYTLKEPCKVYALDFERTLSPIPVQSYPITEYPYFDVKTTDINYKFTAEAFFVPSAADGLSKIEEEALDIVLLRVLKSNDYNFSHKPFYAPGTTSTIAGYGFPFSPVSSLFFNQANNDKLDQQVIVPGFAFQAIGTGAFETLRLLPITGKVITIFGGDQKFKNQPLNFEFWNSPDAFGGRSGAPIFWNGYLIGLIQTKSENIQSNSYQVAIHPFLSLLKEKGLLYAIKELY